jgi:thiamine-phosphate pyrophosphorylase
MKNLEALNGVNVLVHGTARKEHNTPPPTIQLTQGLTENGKTFIQLRDKGMSDEAMTSWGLQMRKALDPKIPLIINDRVAVAMAIRDSGIEGQIGLHVGQSDTPASEVRRLIGDDMILGVSASTVEQAIQAKKDGADYLGVGPLFPTKNKDDADPPIGLRGLAEIRAAVEDIPIIAIGGINEDNVAAVMRYGANGVAVIGAVLGADDPKLAADTLANIVKPEEKVPRLNSDGVFTQLDDAGNFVGRTVPRKEAEKEGGYIPVVSVFLLRGEGENRQVLIQQRSKHKSRWAGKWEGSAVETAQMHSNQLNVEHPKETALRGLDEEIGVTVEIGQLSKQTFQRFIDKDPDTGTPRATSVITAYTVECEGDVEFKLNPAEVQAVRWVGIDELRTRIKEHPEEYTEGFVGFVNKHSNIFKENLLYEYVQ